MAKKANTMFASVAFDRVFFDPNFGSYTFRLTSTEKNQKMALHIPIQGSSEEIMGIPFLLTDPLLLNLFKTLRIKVENISLYQSKGVWHGRVEMRWGWWRKRLDIRPIDAIRFSVEFHKPIFVPSDMLRPVIIEKEKEKKNQAYKILFMSKPVRRGEVPHEEIM
ncbi:MAG: bifunctional nuclease domain-containing protein [Brevinematales bacterium]